MTHYHCLMVRKNNKERSQKYKHETNTRNPGCGRPAAHRNLRHDGGIPGGCCRTLRHTGGGRGRGRGRMTPHALLTALLGGHERPPRGWTLLVRAMAAEAPQWGIWLPPEALRLAMSRLPRQTRSNRLRAMGLTVSDQSIPYEGLGRPVSAGPEALAAAARFRRLVRVRGGPTPEVWADICVRSTLGSRTLRSRSNERAE